ncbi:uncharacterized protein N7459_002228 [Penicillium hispanicum]|uniref:uncharacterized protein n=1 Tax=Penicillium hispanicum TaxID=1080232 RepID=UPI00254039F0|nr:uncharacterized protein N7459_002228 [Penicillium hispanicum]KAJ5591859.1 hypothetical protein N7459_002228 [Penicillium hispanicum]
MQFPPYLLDYLCSVAALHLIPAILLLSTRKGSALRYLSIPSTACIASRYMKPSPGASATLCFAIAVLIVNAIQSVNILLINPMDKHDLAKERPERCKNLPGRVFYAIQVLSERRAVNTPRQVKNVPPHPDYYHRDGAGLSRRRFVARQAAVFAWQYLVLDICQALAHREAQQPGYNPHFTPVAWTLTPGEWAGRIIGNLVSWALVQRVLIDAHYRFFSCIYVGLGLDDAENWPPAFARMADAYTLRKFWGKAWHQILRQPFVSISNFLARDVLCLPRPSLLERYTNIGIVFLLSGLVHVGLDVVEGIPLEYSGSMRFFLAAPLGIMIEDGVQALWKRMFGCKQQTKQEGDVLPAWKRVVGYVWAIGWLLVTSTWYLHPISQLPKEDLVLVPMSVVERVGLGSVGGAILISGVALRFLVGVEV